MKRSTVMTIVAAALLLGLAAPSYAWHGRSRVFVGVGPGWWGPPYPYPYTFYDPPAYVYEPPPVIVQQPQMYVQQQPPPSPAFYCARSARAYYPSVQTCAEAWIKVPPPPQ